MLRRFRSADPLELIEPVAMPEQVAAMIALARDIYIGEAVEDYILDIVTGTRESEELAFSSSCHGAGRQMSRHQAVRTWSGRQVVDELKARGIEVRSPSLRGVAEEAPGAYKDVSAVVDAAEEAGLSRKVARVAPLIVIKG